jgi:hypothetical protein
MNKITLHNFRTVKSYMESDFNREIQIAYLSSTIVGKMCLQMVGIDSGAANMMSLLSLLNYTEFAGNTFAQQTSMTNYNPFTVGYERLPANYKTITSPLNLYQTLKNSLIMPVDNGPEVNVSFTESDTGISYKNGVYTFSIITYYKDLMRVLEDLEKNFK